MNLDDPIYELQQLALQDAENPAPKNDAPAWWDNDDVEVEHLIDQRKRILQGWTETREELERTKAKLARAIEWITELETQRIIAEARGNQ